MNLTTKLGRFEVIAKCTMTDLSIEAMPYKNVSGVYVLYCTNGMGYIGSSRNLYSRLMGHRMDLNKNKNNNQRLQDAFNLYGIESFQTGVLGLVAPELRVGAEQRYMDKYPSEALFNVFDAKGPKGVPIIQKDLDGNLIQEFESIVSAAASNDNFNSVTIGACAKGRFRTAYEFVWDYKDEERRKKSEETRRGKKRYGWPKKGWTCSEESKRRMSESSKKKDMSRFYKAVIQLDSNGDFVAKFGSITAASDSVGVTIGTLSNCLRGRTKTAGGFKWSYAKKE